MITGYPYAMAWTATIYNVAWYAIAGSVAGALNKD